MRLPSHAAKSLSLLASRGRQIANVTNRQQTAGCPVFVRLPTPSQRGAGTVTIPIKNPAPPMPKQPRATYPTLFSHQSLLAGLNICDSSNLRVIPTLLNEEQVAQVLRVRPCTVRNERLRGLIGFTKVGNGTSTPSNTSEIISTTNR